MGFDCGFDIYPRLEPTAANRQTYRRFLDEIVHVYQTVYDSKGQRADGKILDLAGEGMELVKPIYIKFMVGERPEESRQMLLLPPLQLEG